MQPKAAKAAGLRKDERQAYVRQGAARRPQGVPDDDKPRRRMGVLAGSRVGIPGNSRKKLLSALLVPQEALEPERVDGRGHWRGPSKLTATH